MVAPVGTMAAPVGFDGCAVGTMAAPVGFDGRAFRFRGPSR